MLNYIKPKWIYSSFMAIRYLQGKMVSGSYSVLCVLLHLDGFVLARLDRERVEYVNQDNKILTPRSFPVLGHWFRLCTPYPAEPGWVRPWPASTGRSEGCRTGPSRPRCWWPAGPRSADHVPTTVH